MSSGGPFRGSRSAHKQPAKSIKAEQPAPVHREQVVENTELEDERVQPVEQYSNNQAPQHYAAPVSVPIQPRKKRSGILLAIIGLLVAALFIGGVAWLVSQGSRTAVDSSKYQAIWLTNGQYYFGKLDFLNRDYIRLTDVFYLQDKQGAADSATEKNTPENQNNLELVKLGSELHGPEDEMIVAKDQVLFYENLKTDGKVAQSISQYKAAGR